MIADIVSLARNLFSLRDNLRTARREKRDRLATYLQQIGSCLDLALEDLRSGGSAVQACAQLDQYVDLIPPTVEHAIGAQRTELLRDGLRRALYVRGLPAPTVEETRSVG